MNNKWGIVKRLYPCGCEINFKLRRAALACEKHRRLSVEGRDGVTRELLESDNFEEVQEMESYDWLEIALYALIGLMVLHMANYVFCFIPGWR